MIGLLESSGKSKTSCIGEQETPSVGTSRLSDADQDIATSSTKKTCAGLLRGRSLEKSPQSRTLTTSRPSGFPPLIPSRRSNCRSGLYCRSILSGLELRMPDNMRKTMDQVQRTIFEERCPTTASLFLHQTPIFRGRYTMIFIHQREAINHILILLKIVSEAHEWESWNPPS